MIKPTVKQVQEYADSIGFDIDAKDFLNHYDTVGWVYGKNRTPIQSWEACVRTWKRRAQKQKQKDERVEAADRIRQRPPFVPTVFVQCVKGRTTGRYLPVILKTSHLETLPNERYISAARDLCEQLNITDGTKWIVREGVSDRELSRERHKIINDSVNATEKPKPRSPLQIKSEVKKQVKAIKNEHVDGDVEFPDDEVPF